MSNAGKMRDLFPFLLSALLLLPLPAASDAAALNDDVLGLIVFKADLHDPLNRLASWNEDAADPCAFAGVTCDRRSSRATDLSLPGVSLSGRIGRGLLRLNSLRSLSLAGNNLSGPLIPDLARLDALRSIDLSSNCLSGAIPADFFSQCRSLRSLSLAGNAFTGEIPASVGSCSTLAALNLSSNGLSGSIPSTLWTLSSLRLLDLSDNSLTGEIAGEVGAMYNLRTINLGSNQLSGALPDGIGRCFLLRFVDLSSNSLSGGLPGSMRRLSMCVTLSLSANSFSGVVPVWVGELTSLQSLDLSSNGFSGPVPETLSKLQLLRELNLSGNALTGSLPEKMVACRSLAGVDFSRNSLTGGLPAWISTLGLQRFLISGNKLSGRVEIQTGGGRLLQVLDLSGNGFSGGIPMTIGEARGLVFVNMSQNSLSGKIPVSMGELVAVEVIDLSQNQLNGSIPPELGSCYSLTSLILSRNDLTGPIPPTMANLTNLQAVDLSLNKLTGGLPKQLANLPGLLTFNVSDNLLSGDLPGGSFFNTINPSSVSGNPGLCGAAANRSCPGVLPKPIVLNPDSSVGPSTAAFPNRVVHHRKIILSISVLIAIGAAALMAVGIIAITILNARVRYAAATAPATSQSAAAAAPALYSDYHSHSPASGPNSGKIIMLSGEDPEFNTTTQPLLKKDCEIGRGGFGTVYKTILRDGRQVAIKRLYSSGLVKLQDDFVRAVRKLGRLTHPNLVRLQGYYWTQSMQLLVYEFVPCGSLHKHLHESTSPDALSWGERFNIVLGMARSLAHLHRHNIIHYNLKSSNVLIDGAGEAKIGDYGLDKLLPMPNRYLLSSKIQSVLGYTAPEFACRSVRVTEKCDVYGFGALVLEVVTGRRPVEYIEDDVVLLCDVVRSAVDAGRVEECVDGRLGGKFPPEEAVPVMKLGLACMAHMPSNRPEMEEVVNILEMMRSPIDSQEEELS